MFSLVAKNLTLRRGKKYEALERKKFHTVALANAAVTRTKVAFRLLGGNLTAMVSRNSICVRLLSVYFCLTIGYGAEV